jgi:hypothetical protein
MVTPCSLARGSDVLTSEYHKRLCDVLTSKLRRRPRVNEQQVLGTVYQLPRFYARIPVQLLFPTALLFALSRFVFFAGFYFSESLSRSALHDILFLRVTLLFVSFTILCCLRFLKWGKAFVLSRYFRVHRDVHLFEAPRYIVCNENLSISKCQRLIVRRLASAAFQDVCSPHRTNSYLVRPFNNLLLDTFRTKAVSTTIVDLAQTAHPTHRGVSICPFRLESADRIADDKGSILLYNYLYIDHPEYRQTSNYATQPVLEGRMCCNNQRSAFQANTDAHRHRTSIEDDAQSLSPMVPDLWRHTRGKTPGSGRPERGL